MSIKEERNMILTMIAEGKISAEEGDLLLQALEQSERNIEEGMKRQKTSRIPGIPSIPSIPAIPAVPRIFSNVARNVAHNTVGNLAAGIRAGFPVHDALGITEDFIEEFEDVGYGNLSYDEFYQFRIHGITPLFIEELEELGLQAGRIGITAADRTGPEYMGLMTFRQLEARLPQATFVFLPKLLHELTYLKSNEEIAAMARAGELVIQALEAVAATARPGVREYQLEAAGTHAIMSGGGRVHLMMIGSTSMRDPKIVFPNPRPSHRLLHEGDIILAEMVAMYKGYSAKIGQPITIGPPTPEMNTFFKEVVLGGFEALRQQLVPGNTLEDVRQAGTHFRQHGAQARPMLVHGLDLITAPPFIYTEQVKAEPFEEQIKPGMTFSIEITPINADGTFGMFLGRTYAITEDGQQDLTPYPIDQIIVVNP